MARFRGTIQGQRGEASRLGHTSSGLVTDNNGWDQGVRVHASVDQDGNDVHEIYVTGGSNRLGATHRIGRLIMGTFYPESTELRG